jgi:hypothetical protein
MKKKKNKFLDFPCPMVFPQGKLHSEWRLEEERE